MAQMTPVQLELLLSECVTIVRPGDVLVVRRQHVSCQDAEDFDQRVAAWNTANGTDLRVLLVEGDSLGVVADGV
jgi:hypothetical protein